MRLVNPLKPVVVVSPNGPGPNDPGDFGPNTVIFGVPTTTAGIQEAINALPNGGTVLLKTGTYNVTTTISLKSGIILEGESMPTGNTTGVGIGASIVNAGVPAGSPVIKLQNIFGCILRSFQVNGNKANNAVIVGSDNILIQGDGLNYLEKVSLVNAAGAGIQVTSSGENVLRNLDVKTNNQYGIYMNNTYDSHIKGCDIGSNVGPGIQASQLTNSEIEDCNVFLNTDHGIVITNCIGVRVINNRPNNNNKNGIIVFNSLTTAFNGELNEVIANEVINNSQAGVGSYSGILLSGNAANALCKYCLVEGNLVWDSQGTKTQAYSIQVGAFCDFNVIKDNILFAGASGTFLNQSQLLNNIVKDNIGYNPVGVLATPFDNTAFIIGKSADNSPAALPTSTANDYTVVGSDVLINDTTPNGGTITIKDPAGTQITAALAAGPYYVPAGFKVRFVTALPTAIVVAAV